MENPAELARRVPLRSTGDAVQEARLHLLSAVVANATDAVAIIGPDGVYLEQNAAHAALTGYSDEELRGATPAIHLGAETFAAVADDLARTGRYRGEVRSRRKDGVVRDLELVAFSVTGPGGELLCHVGIKRDVTDRLRAERETTRRVRELEALVALTESVSRARDEREVYEAALDVAARALDAERAAILIADEAGVMRFQAWRGLGDDYRAAVEGHSPWEPGEPDPRPVLVADAAADPALADYRGILARERIGALAFYPLVHQGRLVGKLMAYYPAAREFPADETSLGLAVARHVAFAIERRRAEDAVRFHAHLLDVVEQAVVATDADGRITYWNRAAERIYGWTPAEAVGQSVGILVAPGSEDAARDILARLAAGATWTGEFEVRRKDGSTFTAQVTDVPIHEGGRLVGIVGVSEDVTARKQAAAALVESEARFRHLVEHVPAVTYLTAADGSGRTVYVSPQCEALLGYPPSAWTGDPGFLASRVHLDDRERVAAERARAVARGDAFALEYRLLARDGRVVWVRDESVPVRDDGGVTRFHQGLITDLTDRHRADEELHRQEQEFRALAENAPDLIARFDRRLRHVYVNAAAERALDRPRARVLGRTLGEAGVPPEAARLLESRVAEAFRTAREAVVEYALPSPDGVRHYQARILPETSREGASEFALVVSRDMTARRESEERTRFLAEAASLLSASLDVESAVDGLARLAVPRLADAAVVALVDDGRVEPIAVVHADPGVEAQARTALAATPLDLAGMSPLARVARTGEYELAAAGADPLRVALAARSALVVPLVARGRVVGSLALAHGTSGRRFTSHDVVFVQEIARRTALALDNARLYRAEQEARRAAERAAERTSRLLSVTAALSEAATPAEVARVVERGCRGTLAAREIAVVLADEQARLRLFHNSEPSAESALAWNALLASAPTVLVEAMRSRSIVAAAGVGERMLPNRDSARAREHFGSGGIVAVPLVVQGYSIGAVGLLVARDVAVTDEDRAFLLALGRQAAQAFERSRLYAAERAARADVEAARRKVELLADASRALAGSLDLAATLETAARLAASGFADAAIVELGDASGAVAARAVAAAHPDVELRIARALEAHEDNLRPEAARRVVASGRAEITGGSFADAPGVDGRSLMLLPLPGRGGVIGSLTLAAPAGRRYGPGDLPLAEDLARRVGLAVDSARLYREAIDAQRRAERAAERTSRLQAVTAALAEALSPGEVAEIVASHGADALGAPRVAVALPTQDGAFIEVVHARGVSRRHIEGGYRVSVNDALPLPTAWREARDLWIENEPELLARFPRVHDASVAAGSRALAAVPLVVEGRSIGAVIFGFDAPRRFDPEDRSLLLAFARQGASALERTRLYTAERDARRVAEDAVRAREASLAALRESEARLAAVLDNSAATIALKDLDGRYLLVNRAALEILRRPREEVVGSRDEDLFDAAAAATLREQDRRVLAGMAAMEFEVTLPLPDGPRTFISIKFPVRDATGEAYAVGLMWTDITARKLAQEALRESEERFRALVDGVRDYAIVMLDSNGRVASWNSGATALHGYHSHEAVGRHTAAFYTEDDVHAGRLEEDLRTASREGRCETEGWRVRKDGSRFWANVILTALRDEHGELRGYSQLTRDLTERKRAEAELEASRRRLAQSETLSALGALVTGVAHEIRTPLTYLSNNLMLLRMKLDRSAAEDPRLVDLARELVAYSESALEGVERINRLVRELRPLSKPGMGDRAPADLREVVGAAVSLFQATQRGRVRVESDLQTATAEVDKVQIQQVVLNLLTNAADAQPRDNLVRVRLRAAPEGGAVIEVEDRGKGLTPEAQARLFDPFYTTKTEGMGLGLSISRRIVDAHGGTIRFETKEGVGTTFIITLPARAARAP